MGLFFEQPRQCCLNKTPSQFGYEALALRGSSSARDDRKLVALNHLARGARPLLLREQSVDGCASQDVDWQHTYSWLQFVRP